MSAASHPDECDECGRPLIAYADFARYGWVALAVAYRERSARVHTLCRSRFEARSYDEKVERVRAAR